MTAQRAAQTAKQPCCEDGCDRPKYARHRCSMHYSRIYRELGSFIEPRTVGSGNIAKPQTPLAARLKTLRRDARLTRDDLAQRLSTRASRICDWEIGVNTPTLPTLQKFAGVYGMTVSQLLDGVM